MTTPPKTATPQRGILEPVPPLAAALVFDLDPGADPRPGLEAARRMSADADLVLGVGEPLVRALGVDVRGLRTFPAISGVGVAIPSKQGALWTLFRGKERGAILDDAMALHRKLGKGWRLLEEVDAFRYREGRDLTGFEDGTENPKDDAAIEASVIAKGAEGVVGGSFVAVQRFVHDLERFHSFDAPARDAVIGRRFETNEEIPDAVASAHVKRSAQESFDPPAFMVRRSMPFGGVAEHGLYFVAYVESLDRFERVLRRMVGLDDRTVDGLFGITRATSGGYYFCPPVHGGAVDLRAIGM